MGDALAERLKVDGAALRMQVELALGKLGHFRWAAGDGDARDGMGAQVFQQAADEIAHVDQRMIGQAMKRADGGLGRFPGRSADVGAFARARDVHAAHDRVNPGRARIGHDDAGRAQDRQAADQPRRPLAVRSAIFSPPGIEISTIASTPAPCRSATSARLARIIARGAGLIAGSPGLSGSPGRVTVPTPSPAFKLNSGAWGREAHGRHDQRAMGDVRVVARVLDNAGAGEIDPELMGREREFGPRPFGSATGTGSGKAPVRSASKAARAAPLAHAPVVQPRLRLGFFVSLMSVGLARWRASWSRTGVISFVPAPASPRRRNRRATGRRRDVVCQKPPILRLAQ